MTKHVSDAFARDMSSLDVVNIAHVRVAGVGGLGLMVVAAIVVLQFALLWASYALGAVGGLGLGLWLIRYRRAHPGQQPVPAFVHLSH